MNSNLYIVLMAGGVGVRFWPYSRNARPKQFLDVLGTGRSLLQATYDRFIPLCPVENILVVTHEEHVQLVKEQLPDLPDANILAEPMRKNTAACIAYASIVIAAKNPNAVMVVTPADHLILKETNFHELVKKACDQAQNDDKLITIGITPSRPETGYGYIQYHTDKNFIKKVKTFTEKPELSLAKKFLESGDFVWNAGIFIWSVKSILAKFTQLMPEMTEIFEELKPNIGKTNEKEAVLLAYSQCKNISIDYGIMEKADNVYVVLGNFTWSDLGSWGSIYELAEKDSDNNVLQGNAQLYDSRNCIVRSSENTLIVAQGLNGYLIGEFGNVVIVCEKDKEEMFRRFVNDVKANPRANEFL